MTAPPFGVPVSGNAWDALDGVSLDVPRSISVVMPYYEQPRQLARVLEALERQTHPRDLVETIVVDDGSKNSPVVPRGVTLLRQEDEGFRAAAARNRGAAAASGDILVFLDADTVPEPEFLSRIARLPSLTPEAVVVGRRRHADLTEVDAGEHIEEIAPTVELAEPDWLRSAYERSGNLLRADNRSYRFVITAVLACTRWMFEEVGGFDETLRQYGGEDWEWAWRAWCAGAVLAHEPTAVAWHDGPDWRGRREGQEQKNAETLRLQERISVRQAGPHALRRRLSDVRIVLDGSMSATLAIITVDSLLRASPNAEVVVDPAMLPLFGDDPRVRSTAGGSLRAVVQVHEPIVLRADVEAHRAFVALTDAVGCDDLGAVVLGSTQRAVMTIESSRFHARASRWQQQTFQRRVLPLPDGISVLEPESSLAAYYGEWGAFAARENGSP